MAEALAEAGYDTAFIGDTNNSPQFRLGFDYEEIIPVTSKFFEEISESQVRLHSELRQCRMPEEGLRKRIRNAMGWDGDEDQRAARTMRQAAKWLANRRSRYNILPGTGKQKPFFLYVDTFDPHEPWDMPQYYTDLYNPGYRGNELKDPAYEPANYATKAEIEHMRCLYAAKLTMVDRWVGHLLDAVELSGLADDTTIIFTSDHGFYLGEHNLIGKVLLDRQDVICGRWPLYDCIGHPPLLVSLPGETNGRRHSELCQPPDVMPTILDVLDVPLPPTVQGKSLLPMIRSGEPVRDCAVTSPTYVQDREVCSPTCFRTEERLYVYGGDEWESELYNTILDPAEEQNIVDSNQEEAHSLHKKYIEFLEEIGCPDSSLELRRAFPARKRDNLPHRKII